ncbi:MAG: hypothetical protein COS89_06795 [Deltaproteobacteria bacterium CG07_land_8_20_14_0_80_38_7]|nr:MAG: hypothetical protein COS89_06795 [Deltaproteobacteria bacterium CG07_land_8_20_14_0_80_38_7]
MKKIILSSFLTLILLLHFWNAYSETKGQFKLHTSGSEFKLNVTEPNSNTSHINYAQPTPNNTKYLEEISISKNNTSNQTEVWQKISTFFYELSEGLELQPHNYKEP